MTFRNWCSVDNAWYVVLKASRLKKKPIAVMLMGESYVIYRNQGRLLAKKDCCPHQGYPLSQGKVKDGCIECPYHGWKFNDDGCLASIPANQSSSKSKRPLLKSYLVKEQGGYIWLNVGGKTKEPVILPKAHHTHQYSGVIKMVNAEIVDILENFLDATHTHYVHTGVIRSGKQKQRHHCDVHLKNIEQGYEAVYREEKQQSGLLSKIFGGHIIESVGRVLRPGIAEIEYRSKLHCEMLVSVHVTPVDQGKCQLFLRTYLKRTATPFILKVLALYPLQMIIFYQGKRILEKQYKSHSQHKEFSPLFSHTDIMRKCIESVLNDEMQPVEKKLKIFL